MKSSDAKIDNAVQRFLHGDFASLRAMEKETGVRR
jgi:hypothetical protein